MTVRVGAGNLTDFGAVRVKMCGLMGPEDAALANQAKPDYAGFILTAGYRRSVTAQTAAAIRQQLSGDIKSVGVFVNEPVSRVAALANAGLLDAVQLHGEEDAEYVAELRRLVSLPLIKAFVLRSADDVARANECAADLVLLDGGTGEGKAFDWELLAKVKRPYLLAGGLNPENVGEALQAARKAGAAPFALDVSSGLEVEGRKDLQKMMDFQNAVHSCGYGKDEMVKKTDDKGNSCLSRGRFGEHGGQYIPETLMNAVIQLEEAYDRYKDDPQFQEELADLFNNYAGRPSRLYYAEKMTQDLGGAKIYLKREDMNHTGAHKINNVLGQALLAKKMGKTRLIAETGAGQHGVATATAAALLGMECVVFMGKEDTERQALNVYKMRLLGAEVRAVESGTATLKDAVSETFREWTNRIDDTHYCLGSVMGPHPFPTIVRDFQAVISKEIKEQCLAAEGKLPDAVLACVGGGSNAIGTFYNFIEDEGVRLIGCEAAGRGIDTYETAATMNTGRVGIFHGMKSYFCQDQFGQIAPVYSISAGLDYPGIGPEHAWLADMGRAEYVPVTDDEAVDAFEYLSRMEGIIPAIESAHAVAHALKLAPTMSPDQIMVITLSGRGDKDCAAIARYRGEEIFD